MYNPVEKSMSGCGHLVGGVRDSNTTLFDDFNEKSNYWYYRVDNYAKIVIEDSVLKLIMGPTEALYYSNAEISDGDFKTLRWLGKNLEFRIRLIGEHYGSAGWGFWNYTMVIDECVPIWFIYLRSTSKHYPLNGFYVQVGNTFTPIKYFTNPPLTIRLGLKLVGRFTPLKFTTFKPAMPDLNLNEWHKYSILWFRDRLVFKIDGKTVLTMSTPKSKYKFRVDVWIDNAVFTPLRGDYARVYRHITHENRVEGILEVDYVKLW